MKSLFIAGLLNSTYCTEVVRVRQIIRATVGGKTEAEILELSRNILRKKKEKKSQFFKKVYW